MPWPPSAPYLIALTISAAISVALALYAWRHRPAPGAMPFVVLMLAVAEWTLVTAFRMASPDLPTKILWAQVRYVGIVIVPAAWLVFALAYTGQGQWLTRLPRVLLLAVEPAVFLLLVWTNPHHHLVWTDIQLDTSGGFPGWHAAHGVAYWFHAIYAYLLLLLATWHLVRVAVRTPQPLLYRRQAAILLLAAIAPATGCTLSTLDLSPWPFVDLAPFGFIVAGLFAVWGFYQLRLLDIVPVARGTIIEVMTDGIIVLDAQGRVVDLNPAAQRLTEHSLAEAIGQPANRLFADRFDPLAQAHEATEPYTEVVLGVGEAQRDFNLSVSPLRDQKGRITGHLMIVHDITERLVAFRLAQQRLAELDVLGEVGRALTAMLNQADLLETIYRQVGRILYAENLTIALYDEAADEVEFAFLMHEGQRYPVSRQPADQGLVGYIVRTRQPLLLRGDASAQVQALGIVPLEIESRAYLGVPLIYGGRVLGVLSVQHHENAAAYDGAQLWLLQAIANQAAIALHNAQLFQQVENERQIADALAQLARIVNSTLDLDQVLDGALEQLAQVIAYDSSSILLVAGPALTVVACRGFADPAAVIGATVHLEEDNIAHRVMRAQQARVEPDVQQLAEWGHDRDDMEGTHTIRAWIGVPLIVHGESIGLLTLDKQQPGFYTEEDKEPAAAFGAQVATAIHNARLYQALQREHNQLAAILNDATDAVLVLDAAGQVLLLNPAAENYLRVRAAAVVGQPVTALGIGDLVMALMEARATNMPMVREIAGPGGRTLYASLSPVHEVGWVVMMQDITALKELDRLRTEWVADVSHDMKNPLTAIQLSAELMKDLGSLDQNQRQMLDMVTANAARMRSLVTDVLDLARLEAGPSLQLSPVDLCLVLQEALRDVEPFRANKGQTLSVDCPSDLPLVRGAAVLLMRAVVNLLDNAIKYTPAEGQINIQASVHGQMVRVEVIDTGPGIPTEAQLHLFDRFYRVAGGEAAAEGSGLGLSIVKTIVEKHGGQVWVTSEPGRGSTFGFAVPISQSS